MICEIIREPKSARGFVNLSRYLVGAERGVDPQSWERLNSYILGSENEKGEIVADVRLTNCKSPEIGLAVKEMALNNGRDVKSRASRVMHLAISLAPGETLTPEQFASAEQRYVDALGLGLCQRISATHLSKEHMHRHVAIATASAPDGKNRRPKHDYAKVMAVSKALERELGLKIANHERGTGRAINGSFLEFARENAAELTKADSWARLHDIAAEHGMYIKPRAAGLVIGSIAEARLSVRASRVSRELSFKALTERLGEFQHDIVQRAWEKQSCEFTAYRKERWQQREAFNRVYNELRERQKAYTAELSSFYSTRIKAEMDLHGRPSQARRYNIGIIVKQRDAAHAKRREEQKRERQQLLTENTLPTFAQWRAKVEAERKPKAMEKTKERVQEREQELER